MVARNSSFSYKGKAINDREVGRELGVKYVLEGSIQKAAKRVRVGVELVDTSIGAEVWTQRFDRSIADIFAVQDEIVNKVVTTVGLLFRLDELKVLQPAAFRSTG